MVLMISAKQDSLDGPVEARFGRSPWLIRYEIETKTWEAFQNPGISESGGAGIAAAQFVINKGATTVISGSFGPNASQALKAANINMTTFTSEVDTVKKAVEMFDQGNLPVFHG